MIYKVSIQLNTYERNRLLDSEEEYVQEQLSNSAAKLVAEKIQPGLSKRGLRGGGVEYFGAFVLGNKEETRPIVRQARDLVNSLPVGSPGYDKAVLLLDSLNLLSRKI